MALARQFSTLALISLVSTAMNGLEGCRRCHLDGTSYTDCSACDVGADYRPCERMSALLADRRSPVGKLTAWSPDSGGAQSLDAVVGTSHVPWAPALAYAGGRHLYVVGGDYAPQSDAVHAMDMGKERWPAERMAALPARTDWPGNGVVGVAGGQLVACGGYSNDTGTCQYITVGDNATESTWRTVATSAALCGRRAAVASHRCRVYISGGLPANRDPLFGEVPTSSAVHSYDPATGTFRREPSMLRGRNEHAMASFGGALVVCGGMWLPAESESADAVLRSCEALRDGAQHWVEIAAMQRPRVQFAMLPLNGRLAAIGGWNHSSVELLASGPDAQWTMVPDALGAPWGWMGAAAVPRRYVDAALARRNHSSRLLW